MRSRYFDGHNKKIDAAIVNDHPDIALAAE
jgi:hypothetical protein